MSKDANVGKLENERIADEGRTMVVSDDTFSRINEYRFLMIFSLVGRRINGR